MCATDLTDRVSVPAEPSGSQCQLMCEHADMSISAVVDDILHERRLQTKTEGSSMVSNRRI